MNPWLLALGDLDTASMKAYLELLNSDNSIICNICAQENLLYKSHIILYNDRLWHILCPNVQTFAVCFLKYYNVGKYLGKKSSKNNSR